MESQHWPKRWKRVVKERRLKRVILVGHSMGGPSAWRDARMEGSVVQSSGLNLQNADALKKCRRGGQRVIEDVETNFAA